MRISITLASLLLAAGLVSAGEKKLMHCFYFTPNDNVAEADWQAFTKATEQLPEKIPGFSRIWFGKLVSPRQMVYSPDEQTRKTLNETGNATGPMVRMVHQYGVCMEFADQAALKVYSDHPAHKAWDTVYFKIRKGSIPYDIVGQ